MEEKINIAEVLKNKPQGTKLYSPIFGNLRYEDLVPDLGEFTVVTSDNTSAKHSFRSDGRYNRHGEPLMLLPSKEMRDWRKFAWKKGDVLVSNDGKIEVIFEKFGSDTYQSFIGKHHLDSLDENLYYQDGGAYPTASFNIETEDAAQTYINTIEERLDGKLNHETLEIEKAQSEFKDGDILYAEKDEEHVPVIFILKSSKEGVFYYACLTLGDYILCDYKGLGHVGSAKFRFATEEEKKKLFDILAIENKAWDAEKKMIVDLKKKVELKPFDKVVVRCSEADRWSIDFFSYKAPNGYICTGDAWFGYCLPYNEETAKLIGTTNNWEG